MAKIEIEYLKDGPFVVKKDGHVEAALCRCGASNKKPFCDGCHHNVHFKAEGGKIEMQC